MHIFANPVTYNDCNTGTSVDIRLSVSACVTTNNYVTLLVTLLYLYYDVYTSIMGCNIYCQTCEVVVLSIRSIG